MSHVNAQILRLALSLFSPYRSQQLSMGNNLPGVLNKYAKERIFSGSKLNLRPSEPNLPRRKIHTERAGSEHGLAAFGERSALCNPDACQQFRGIERLGYI